MSAPAARRRNHQDVAGPVETDGFPAIRAAARRVKAKADDESTLCVRFRRLITLMQLMQSRSTLTVEALANHCGVTRRTIFRDLQFLKAAGVGVQWFAEEGRYDILAGDAPVVRNLFAQDFRQLVSLFALCFAPGKTPEWCPQIRDAQEALLKLTAKLDPDAMQSIWHAVGGVHYRVPETKPDGSTVWNNLWTAYVERRKIRVELATPNEDRAIRTLFSPVALTLSQDETQFTGRSTWHRATVTIGLNAIRSSELTEESFEAPSRPPRRHRRQAVTTA